MTQKRGHFEPTFFSRFLKSVKGLSQILEKSGSKSGFFGHFRGLILTFFGVRVQKRTKSDSV